MNFNGPPEHYGLDPSISCKSAFMELSSTPVSAHGYNHSYNTVPPNYNPYSMRFYHNPSTPDYPIPCNARNSFAMPPILSHPLSHHPYLSTPLPSYPSAHDPSLDGEWKSYTFLGLLRILKPTIGFLAIVEALVDVAKKL